MKILKAIFGDKSLRKRILFVIGILVITRVIATIPIPAVGTGSLEAYLRQTDATKAVLGLLNIFSGGGLSTMSIAMLGVGPYITASIIMQLMTVLSPALKEMNQEEGEKGRRKFVQYGRLLTLPFALLQGAGLLVLLSRQNIIEHLSRSAFALNLITITAGTLLLMWLGEQINERGIGNGVSLIIFAGIVAALPKTLAQSVILNFDVSQIPLDLALLAVSLVSIYFIVYITEAERPIEVTYAKQARLGASSSFGYSTYIPLRLNQAGVVPIIFAISILLFPQLIAQLLQKQVGLGAEIAKSLTAFVQNHIAYGITYFLLVFVFTYFYTAIIFEPEKTAENLQKNSAFIPGFRPGVATAHYIDEVLTRITLVGALFLGFVAVLPYIVQSLTGFSSVAIGGTSLLIAISVVLDLIKKVDAQVTMREY
jgi:preprotein translocase subunit SecY